MEFQFTKKRKKNGKGVWIFIFSSCHMCLHTLDVAGSTGNDLPWNFLACTRSWILISIPYRTGNKAWLKVPLCVCEREGGGGMITPKSSSLMLYLKYRGIVRLELILAQPFVLEEAKPINSDFGRNSNSFLPWISQNFTGADFYFQLQNEIVRFFQK